MTRDLCDTISRQGRTGGGWESISSGVAAEIECRAAQLAETLGWNAISCGVGGTVRKEKLEVEEWCT